MPLGGLEEMELFADELRAATAQDADEGWGDEAEEDEEGGWGPMDLAEAEAQGMWAAMLAQAMGGGGPPLPGQ